MFSKEDEKIIADKGISLDTINHQLMRFNKGFPAIDLNRPATIGDGIYRLSSDDEARLAGIYDGYKGTALKFVPASGAASRMFKDLLNFKNTYTGSEADYEQLISNPDNPVYKFFKNLDSFAFYPELKVYFEQVHETSLAEAHLNREFVKILESLLSETGLNYANYPKGLLSFHSYENTVRTPAEEHIFEGLEHTADHQLNIHFTVSPDHLDAFSKHIDNILTRLKNEEIYVSFSSQKPNTDIVAVDGSNNPFRDEHGNLFFRPAGHGALLENLMEVDSDIVFIKNIDNILPDHYKELSIKWKKILAGILIEYQRNIFDLLERNEAGEDVTDDGLKLLSGLGIEGSILNDEVISYLNRPIRVCGMVRNEGEPGGGPFWINTHQTQTLQIVERAQIDLTNDEQLKIANTSTHFNPVDLVCSFKNFRGKKFDLAKFRDLEQGFISKKSYQGRALRAMELPGLWNGSMADWNTIFVEIPIETFNPVKTVNDLLKKEHQPFNTTIDHSGK